MKESKNLVSVVASFEQSDSSAVGEDEKAKPTAVMFTKVGSRELFLLRVNGKICSMKVKHLPPSPRMI
jgi:hypothetical protein